MSPFAEQEPQPRDVRASGRDARLFEGADGAQRVTNGNGPLSLIRAGPVIAALLTVICIANVFSQVHDAARAGIVLPYWQPITWEATSGISELAASGIIWMALRAAPPSARQWLKCLVVHTAASVLFSVVHVVGMWSLRMIVYALVGAHYSPSGLEALYEYRKDFLTYAGLAALLWLVPRLTLSPHVTAPVHLSSARLDYVDIQEGVRMLRIPVGDILALHAAGNYVEFLLKDGRRPLMRAPLGEIASSLENSGFLRTHRSWAVNLASVRILEPTGSGDYQVALDGGETVPVSRRFPRAVERLRAQP